MQVSGKRWYWCESWGPKSPEWVGSQCPQAGEGSGSLLQCCNLAVLPEAWPVGWHYPLRECISVHLSPCWTHLLSQTPGCPIVSPSSPTLSPAIPVSPPHTPHQAWLLDSVQGPLVIFLTGRVHPGLTQKEKLQGLRVTPIGMGKEPQVASAPMVPMPPSP